MLLPSHFLFFIYINDASKLNLNHPPTPNCRKLTVRFIECTRTRTTTKRAFTGNRQKCVRYLDARSFEKYLFLENSILKLDNIDWTCLGVVFGIILKREG